MRALNKLVCKIRSEVVVLTYWPLKGNLRLIGYPNDSSKNNSDKSRKEHLLSAWQNLANLEKADARG
eukprot:12883237-Prorocentrum_lima.AAC.1